MGYWPEQYFVSIEEPKIPFWKQVKGYVTEITVGSKKGATVPVQIGKSKCNALVDTGASKSVMCEEYFQQLMLPDLKQIYNIDIKSASGNKIKTIGITQCTFSIGEHSYTYDFVLCKNLSRPFILGIDFLRQHLIDTCLSPSGKLGLRNHKTILIESLETSLSGFLIHTRNCVEIPGRHIIVLDVKVNPTEEHLGQMYNVQQNMILQNEYPALVTVPTLHKIETLKPTKIQYILINFAKENVFLPKGELLGSLEPLEENIQKIVTSTSMEMMSIEEEENQNTEVEEVEKKFITSPAEVEVHQKINLQDAKITEEDLQQFKKLCEEYDDILSKDSTGIGRTPLVTMEIDTGDSPPITQRPYNLPLKHSDWVQRELDTLEKAGVIIRSVSPWASPIVIVPKKTEPGEPPRRRLCVDYRALNNLLPTVQKVGSKAKGVLTLVPLPKIDEMYAKLKGSFIFSMFDMRSGYHHVALSPESQAKLAFVIGGPHGHKFEFKVCPAQAPAYFQRLVDEVLRGLPFAFGYLDDILIFSPNIKTHLEHIKILFDRLRKANLKLKESKCTLLKKHVQYLGHLISGEGIEPIPEKLDNIKNMPASRTSKEIKQFLGLIGYYRKFIP